MMQLVGRAPVRTGRRWTWVAGIGTGVVVLLAASVVTGMALRDAGPASSSMTDGGAADAVAPSPGESALAPGLSREAAPTVPTDPLDAGQEVIRTTALTVEVADPVAAAGEVRAAVAAAGGYVAEERGSSTSSGFTLRVPVDRLDALTARLGGLGTVTARNSSAQDVTGQVADLDGRIAAQQASVNRVRALLDRATTISEITSVEAELSSREADLESLQRRAAVLRDRTELSTVELSLMPAPAVAPPAGSAGFLGGLAVGWEGLRSIGLGALAALGFVVPMLPLVAVAVGLVLLGRRWYRRRHRSAPPADPA